VNQMAETQPSTGGVVESSAKQSPDQECNNINMLLYEVEQ